MQTQKLTLWGFALLIFWMAACQNDNGVQEIRGGKNADLIRNPAQAGMPLDTNQLARMVFEEKEFNFGEVLEGDVVTHIYKFKNTGTVPLIISDARSSCGCTIPEWPNHEIKPGETGEIKATFNSENRAGDVKKRITVTANAYPNQAQVTLKGHVKPKDK